MSVGAKIGHHAGHLCPEPSPDSSELLFFAQNYVRAKNQPPERSTPYDMTEENTP